MTTQESDRLKTLRQSIAQHMEDSAMLVQQLPEEEHDYYLLNAVGAWQLVAAEPMSPELLQRMVEALFSGDGDDIEEISATGPGEAA
jgi:uncharacterized membrane-anchored protein YhcB (DUF1043 family)